jgi:hypothetical protein
MRLPKQQLSSYAISSYISDLLLLETSFANEFSFIFWIFCILLRLRHIPPCGLNAAGTYISFKSCFSLVVGDAVNIT